MIEYNWLLVMVTMAVHSAIKSCTLKPASGPTTNDGHNGNRLFAWNDDWHEPWRGFTGRGDQISNHDHGRYLCLYEPGNSLLDYCIGPNKF